MWKVSTQCWLSLITLIRLHPVAKIDSDSSPLHVLPHDFNSSHCKAMKHWRELSCSIAYVTAIVGRDQQAVSFLAEMPFCQHLLQPMKTVLLDTDAAHWGLRTDYSTSREGKASTPDLLSGKLECSYSSCCHSLEPRQHFPWWLHNLE